VRKSLFNKNNTYFYVKFRYENKRVFLSITETKDLKETVFKYNNSKDDDIFVTLIKFSMFKRNTN